MKYENSKPSHVPLYEVHILFHLQYATFNGAPSLQENPLAQEMYAEAMYFVPNGVAATWLEPVAGVPQSTASDNLIIIINIF